MPTPNVPPSLPQARGPGRPRGGAVRVGREGLVLAVCELLKTNPPGEITNSKIAAQAGAVSTLIGYYFGNRIELMAAAAERVIRESDTMAAEAVKFSSDPKSELFARVGALVDINTKYPFFNRLLNEEIRPSQATVARSLIADLTERATAEFREIIQRGIEAGIFRPIQPTYVLLAAVSLAESGAALRDFRLDQNLFARNLATAIPGDDIVGDYRDYVCRTVFNGVATLDALIADSRQTPQTKPALPRARKTPPTEEAQSKQAIQKQRIANESAVSFRAKSAGVSKRDSR